MSRSGTAGKEGNKVRWTGKQQDIVVWWHQAPVHVMGALVIGKSANTDFVLAITRLGANTFVT